MVVLEHTTGRRGQVDEGSAAFYEKHGWARVAPVVSTTKGARSGTKSRKPRAVSDPEPSAK